MSESESIDSLLRHVARAPPVEPARFGEGDHIGPYEIRGFLGAGGMGQVYRAWDPRLGREVAVKIMSASDRRDDERARRFEQEALAAGALDHPNIVAIYDAGMHDNTPYLVFALLDGMTLRELLVGAALDPKRATELALQTAAGLAAAHAQGIVHRDLKPENVFLTKEGQIKVLDFGLAKLGPLAPAESNDLTDEGTLLGTAPYMSPEQVRGLAADARSDVFAFGAILYEMLSGRRAFGRETSADTIAAILTADPPPIARRVPPALARVVARCLAKRADDRFQSVPELISALHGVTFRQPRRGRRAAAIGALVGVIVAGAGITAHVMSRDDPAPRAFTTAATGRVALALTMGGTGTTVAHEAVRGADGTLYVVGLTTTSFRAGEIAIDAPGTIVKGFLLAFSPAGRLRWSRVIGQSDDTHAIAMTLVGDRVVITGVYRKRIELGNGVDLPALPRAGQRDGFVAAFRAEDGRTLWARSCGASLDSHPHEIIADPDGNVYITGNYRGAARFGGTTVQATPEEGSGVFVVSYTPDGTFRWATAGPVTGKHARAFALAHRDGALWFGGLITRGLQLGDTTVPADDGGDGFVAALDARTGALRWVRAFGGRGSDYVRALAFLSNGDAAIGGAITEGAEIVAGAPAHGAGDQDSFVALLDRTDGHATRVWSGGAAGTDGVKDLAVGPGGIVVVGAFQERVRLGDREVETHGSMDGYLAEIDPVQGVTALAAFGGASQDSPRSLAVAADGTIRVTGKFRLDADLFGQRLRAVGSIDSFVVELRP